MSSARVDYIAPWWTYWLHQFPHVNLRFQPLDHTFKPQEENYQQVRPSVYTVIQRFMVQTVKISFVHRTVTLSLSLGLRVILHKYSDLITCFGSHVTLHFLRIPVYSLVSLNLFTKIFLDFFLPQCVLIGVKFEPRHKCYYIGQHYVVQQRTGASMGFV